MTKATPDHRNWSRWNRTGWSWNGWNLLPPCCGPESCPPERCAAADTEVVDHLFPFLRRGSDDAGGIQNPIVQDEHFLSGPKFAGLQKYPAGQPDRVFRGRSKHALIRLDRYDGRAGREELLHAGLDHPPFRVDRPHPVSRRQIFNGGLARGCADHRSGGETPASAAFVMHRNAAGKEGVRMIGLKVENRDPFSNPLQRQNALFRQGLPFPGKNGVAHLEDVECLEGAMSDIEGMLCGGPDGLPFGRENDIFIHSMAKDISHLCLNDPPFRRIGQQRIPRPDSADRLFGAVGLQNQALGKKASLVVNDDAGRNERPAGHHQQIIRRWMGPDTLNGTDWNRIQVSRDASGKPGRRPSAAWRCGTLRVPPSPDAPG